MSHDKYFSYSDIENYISIIALVEGNLVLNVVINCINLVLGVL